MATEKEADPKRLMWIEVDPPTPFTYQMVTFRVRFDLSALDCAAAQNEIQCKWFVCESTPDMNQSEKPGEHKLSWDDAELPGAPAERRFSAFSGQPDRVAHRRVFCRRCGMETDLEKANH